MSNLTKFNSRFFIMLLLGLMSMATTLQSCDEHEDKYTSGTYTSGTPQEAVSWSAEVVTDTDDSGHIVLKADVAEGYHFYSFAPDGGYNSLEITTTGSDAIVTIGNPAASTAPESHFEESQNAELSSWDKDVSFTIPFTFTAGEGYKVALKIRYQACDATACLTPKTVNLNVTGNGYAETSDAEATAGTDATAADGSGFTTNAQINTEWSSLPHGAGLIMISKAYFSYFIKNHGCDDRFIELARLMGMTDATKPEDFITALVNLQEACGVADLKMSDYGITPDEFETLMRNTREVMGIMFTADRVQMSDEDIVSILAE